MSVPDHELKVYMTLTDEDTDMLEYINVYITRMGVISRFRRLERMGLIESIKDPRGIQHKMYLILTPLGKRMLEIRKLIGEVIFHE